MNRERVEVTVTYLMNNRWKMHCISLVCREVLQAVGFNILYRNEWRDGAKDGVCFSRAGGGVLTARRLTEGLQKELAKHVEIEIDLMTGKFYKIKSNPLPSKERPVTPLYLNPQPAPAFSDEDHVYIPRGLIHAACSAIDKKRDGEKTLAELRRYTTGDLSRQPAPDASVLVEAPK